MKRLYWLSLICMAIGGCNNDNEGSLSEARWECSACGSLHASGRELKACEGASDKE